MSAWRPKRTPTSTPVPLTPVQVLQIQPFWLSCESWLWFVLLAFARGPLCAGAGVLAHRGLGDSDNSEVLSLEN